MKARAITREASADLEGFGIKTLPFIVILGSAFQHSLKWMRDCFLFRKLKYVGKKLPLFHQEPEKALLIFKLKE